MSSAEDLQTLVLTALDAQGEIQDSKDLATPNSPPLDQLALLGALNSLRSKDMVAYDTIEREVWVLTEEGNELADSGSHEARVFAAVPPGDEGIAIATLQVEFFDSLGTN